MGDNCPVMAATPPRFRTTSCRDYGSRARDAIKWRPGCKPEARAIAPHHVAIARALPRAAVILAPMTLILHYAPDNASLIVRLALEELELPYETRLVDRSVRAQDGA